MLDVGWNKVFEMNFNSPKKIGTLTNCKTILTISGSISGTICGTNCKTILTIIDTNCETILTICSTISGSISSTICGTISKIRSLCLDFVDIFSNELPSAPARISPLPSIWSWMILSGRHLEIEHHHDRNLHRIMLIQTFPI